MRPLHGIILHCAATPPNWMAGQSARAKRDEIDRWHKARGWKGIGYHYLIDRDGTIAVGRPLEETGAHVAGHNTGTVGICLVGGKWPQGAWGLKTDKFSDHFTPAQDRAARMLITDLCERFPSITSIKGHNDYTDSKGCPSFTVSAWLKDAPAAPQRPVEPQVAPAAPKAPGGWLAALLGFLSGLFAQRQAAVSDGPRGFVPVSHQGRTIWVMPDYFKRDGIRMPVDLPEALRIAQARSRELGFPLMLPTKEHIDSIHKAADVRLTMPTRGEPRQALATYQSVDAEIERALAGRTGLVSGHKKEILRPAVRGKVTIYGGMKANGSFWQPRPSSVHGETYTDYSHGLRLVHDPEDHK